MGVQHLGTMLGGGVCLQRYALGGGVRWGGESFLPVCMLWAEGGECLQLVQFALCAAPASVALEHVALGLRS